MRANLIGFKHNVGTFEGKSYDNYKLNLSYPSTNPNVIGEEVGTLKVSTNIMERYMATHMDLNECLGSVDIDLGFNNVVVGISKV